MNEQVPADEHHTERLRVLRQVYDREHPAAQWQRAHAGELFKIITDLRASLRREENARAIAVKDADRYRWLRHQRRWYAASPPVPGIAIKFENLIADNGETLDAAIDAEMRKKS